MKRGKPVADTSLRDTENVPLVQDVDRYFERKFCRTLPMHGLIRAKQKSDTRFRLHAIFMSISRRNLWTIL